MTRRLLAFLTTTIFLLLIGALAGLIIAVLGLALASAFTSLQNSDGVGLLSFLVDLFFLLIDVLAVSTVAAPDGIWAGLISAAAVSLTYGLILWLLPSLQSNRWLLALLFAIVGALAAASSLRSVLADYGVAAAVVGALFGLVASLAVSRGQPSPA
jgi:hypothetical protein